MCNPSSAGNKLKFENLTTPRAPLLKIYYWEYCDIDNLNVKLNRNAPIIDHSIRLPTAQMNSRPFKIIFWLRNFSPDVVVRLQMKRVRNCKCQPVETRVGFNQFRKLYQCPHRNLVHIIQDCVEVRPTELAPMSVVFNYLLYGEYTITYQISLLDSRVINLKFHLDITGFDPQNCILNNRLLPVNVKEIHRFVQPIWVSNISKQYRNFDFTSKEWGFEMLNPRMVVPRDSVWPLMVKYLPSDMENEFDLVLHNGNISTRIPLACRGELQPIISEPNVPLLDYHCVDYPYIVYPNKLEMSLEQNERRTCMLSIHNFHQNCVEFKWQNYIISDLFEITFEPVRLRLKPHHSTLCVATIRSFACPVHFNRVPLVLEVHRVDDKSTRIGRALVEGDDVDSIDQPKWHHDSYTEHIFVQLNVKINFKKEKSTQVDALLERPPRSSAPLYSAKESITIFEKLFWKYLQKTAFNEDSIPDELNCEEVLQLHKAQTEKPQLQEHNNMEALKVLEELLAECLRGMSKSWRFIPPEYAIKKDA